MRWWLVPLAVEHAVAKTVVVACAGDSITAGGHGGGARYPELLGELLGSDYEVHNFGKSGTTVGDGSGFRPWRESDEFEEMTELSYDVAVVMLGTNDAKEELWEDVEVDWVDDYVDLLEALEASSPGARFFVGVPVPYLCCSSKWGDDASIINEALPALARRARWPALRVP